MANDACKIGDVYLHDIYMWFLFLSEIPMDLRDLNICYELLLNVTNLLIGHEHTFKILDRVRSFDFHY